MPDDPEPVTQPLHRGPAHEHAALERVLAGAATPGDGCQEPMPRGLRLVARIHEREAAGAVRVLGHAGIEAGLPEKRCLLVTGDARDR